MQAFEDLWQINRNISVEIFFLPFFYHQLQGICAAKSFCSTSPAMYSLGRIIKPIFSKCQSYVFKDSLYIWWCFNCLFMFVYIFSVSEATDTYFGLLIFTKVTCKICVPHCDRQEHIINHEKTAGTGKNL